MPAPLTVDRLVQLGRRLRAAGLVITPDVSADMVRAADTVGYSRPDRLLFALRAVTVTDRSQLAVFDRVVEEFLGLVHEGDESRVAVTQVPSIVRLTEVAEGSDSTSTPGVAVEVGASAEERLASRDFATLTGDERDRVRSLIARMMWEPPLVRTRRRRPSRRGDRPDFRRSLRTATGPSGDLLLLAWTERQTRRRPLIVISDISGSMEAYAEMFLMFAHAARQRFGPVEAFVFATRLTRITRALEHRDLGGALRRVTADVEDWSGGTRIGEALATFNREWSRRVYRGKPIVMILSDGWDRGDPELLRREMARLSRSVAKVMWLNPLAAQEEFAPETRGMQAALPHIDALLPAASVTDLRSLIALLDREA
jgi:uncharacterized protein with von Willebrand factor type A (vWA) domain